RDIKLPQLKRHALRRKSDRVKRRERLFEHLAVARGPRDRVIERPMREPLPTPPTIVRILVEQRAELFEVTPSFVRAPEPREKRTRVTTIGVPLREAALRSVDRRSFEAALNEPPAELGFSAHERAPREIGDAGQKIH